MLNEALLILKLLLVLVLVVFASRRAIQWLWPDPTVERRIEEITQSASSRQHWLAHVAPLAQQLAKLATPSEDQGLGVRMQQAGMRSALAPSLFYGAKTLLMLTLPLVVWLCEPSSMRFQVRLLLMLSVATLGLYVPTLILNRRIKHRQRRLLNSLPNALEMIRVCVEAGLGFDAALMRVTQELDSNSRELKEEFALTLLEIEAGSARSIALRRLASRTGVEEIANLTSMLIQTDRFGISMGDALRTYTNELRVRRQQRAEEQAGKLAVTLMLPMALCIFPSVFCVLLGPGILSVIRVLFPIMAGL